MNKKLFIFILVISLVFVAALLYFVPKVTPVQLVLDAVKVDDLGNELATVQIVISGSKLDYLFQPSRIDVHIQPFDGIFSIGPTDHHSKYGVIPGMIKTLLHREFLYAYYSGVSEDGQHIIFADLGFSPDLKQWIFRDNTNHVSYVASVDGLFSTKALITYFNGIT
jgi:hypothetical protein